jgi:hypothetical protein
MYSVLGTVIVGILLNLVLLRAILELSKQITEEVDLLDGNIAKAIASVVEKFGFGYHEPINPIQAAIAQLMTSKIQEKSTMPVLRDDNGFFKKSE